MFTQKIYLRVILMCAMILSVSFAFTSKLSAGSADSIVYQNDSVFTIEGVKEELKTDGEWIKVNKSEIDPGAVADESGGFDPEINIDYVWRPTNMEEGWSPYTNGYWNYCNNGWMWVSYYNWGWRTCHYGRWWWSAYYGWVWSPGFVFAPAWVVWMYNDGYCGWYPISPRVRCYNDYNYRCHTMRYKTRCWTFVEKRKFADPITPRVPIVDPFKNPDVTKTPTYDVDPNITKTGVNNNGPKVKTIEDATGKRIAVNDVGMYNNVDKYVDTRDIDKYTEKKNNSGTNGNDGVNNTTGTKNTDGTNGNDGTKTNDDNWYKGDNGTKTKDNTGSNNDGWKKKEDNTGNKNNDGYKQKDGNNGNKQYTPPPQTPPKQDPPKQDPPKQEQPKQDPPKNDNGNNNRGNDSWNESPAPTNQDEGNKSGKD